MHRTPPRPPDDAFLDALRALPEPAGKPPDPDYVGRITIRCDGESVTPYFEPADPTREAILRGVFAEVGSTVVPLARGLLLLEVRQGTGDSLRLTAGVTPDGGADGDPLAAWVKGLEDRINTPPSPERFVRLCGEVEKVQEELRRLRLVLHDAVPHLFPDDPPPA